MNMDFTTSMLITKKIAVQKTSMVTAIASIIAGSLLAVSSAHATHEIVINSSADSSATVVEQHSDGNTATITATPNGITMQDGMPYAVTKVTTVPRYVVRQGGNNPVVQGNTTITSVPVTDQATNTVTKVDVITTPLSNIRQVLPVAPATQLPELKASAPETIQVMTSSSVVNQSVVNQSVVNQSVLSQSMINQSVILPTFVDQKATATSLTALQLTPTFSTPDIITAQTKVMKILKNKEGREMAVPANHIAQGDVIEYHTTYTNITAQPVTGINAMVSLPSGIQLVSLNSLLPTLATTDGNSYQTIQPMSNSIATQANYSGLKWNLINLDANAVETVVIRAKVQ
ncbi:hypothetical protein QL982_12215 [Psychrobacter sp. 5A.1]|uniref:hypothetical protein n=1 Tax=Psychrobacter sp. 5A.1 TaxID=3035207 RepID=UPI0025B2B32D|nr:hypothetical protein [Psychrobacter sp. 5A.1]MDN3503504.1 hypothetical protein [Psychrobacter sp. 5A.1]